jgi:hypothetical protein
LTPNPFKKNKIGFFDVVRSLNPFLKKRNEENLQIDGE